MHRDHDDGFNMEDIKAALHASMNDKDRRLRDEPDIEVTPITVITDEPMDVFGNGRSVRVSTAAHFSAHTCYTFRQTGLRDGVATVGCIDVQVQNRGDQRAPDYVSTMTVRSPISGQVVRRLVLHDAGSITEQHVQRDGTLAPYDVRTEWVLLNVNMCFPLSMVVAERKVWVGRRADRSTRDDWYNIDRLAVAFKSMMRGEASVLPAEACGAHERDVYMGSDCRPVTTEEISGIYETKGFKRDIVIVRQYRDDYQFTAWIRHDPEGHPRAFNPDTTVFLFCYMHGVEHFMPYTNAE